MKLSVNPPSSVNADVSKLLKEISSQVNAITEGQKYAYHSALTAAPTTGTWNVGDEVLNSAPSEITDAVSYVVYGWMCVVAGTPGTWVELRIPTGDTGTGGGGSRWGAGVDTTDDVIIDDSANGVVLKSPDAHYWRVQVTNAGALTITDLGLVKP